jgi:lipoprotein-releasing system permease protein
MSAIAIGSAALIILFSVFNGFENIVKNLYKAFYPDIKISAARGKFFTPPADMKMSLSPKAGVACYSYVLEDNVLANSEEEQIIGTLKGVDSNYLNVNDLGEYIVKGHKQLSDSPVITALVGMRLANQVGADVNKPFPYSYLELYYPDARNKNPILDPENAFHSLKLKPDGTFKVQDDFDSKYVLAPLRSVQELFNEPGKISSIEIKLSPNADADLVKEHLQQFFGPAYKVETRYEQNKTLYMVMRSEKWAVYAILLFILLIASFNMIGALSLLVLEKRKDIAILKIMGAAPGAIHKIFVVEGILWSLAGGLSGMLLGFLVCLGQQHFHWIKLEGSFIIDAYPVNLQWQDFVWVLLTIIAVGLLASWYPAMRATSTEDPSLKSA